MATRTAAIFFLFPSFFFIGMRRTEFFGEKKNRKLKKKVSSRPYSTHPAAGPETTFFLRVA